MYDQNKFFNESDALTRMYIALYSFSNLKKLYETRQIR